MADSPRDPAIREYPSTPRWVKAVGIAAIVVILVVVVVMLVAGGEHGPGRHTGPGDTGAPTPTASGQAVGAVDAPADEGEAARTVELTILYAMTFEPSKISVG